jgi:hypothetical protein
MLSSCTSLQLLGLGSAGSRPPDPRALAKRCSRREAARGVNAARGVKAGRCPTVTETNVSSRARKACREVEPCFSLCCYHLARNADCASTCPLATRNLSVIRTTWRRKARIHWAAGPTLPSPSGFVKRSTLQIVCGTASEAEHFRSRALPKPSTQILCGIEASHTFARVTTS